jgi:hypothetical protein
MVESKLDHLAVAAADLNTGSEYIEDLLGVKTVPGGKHAMMGTHNRLLRLGEDQYLEVIAIDPGGATPARPRWFSLDDPLMQARIKQAPTLVTWVARTPDIDQAAGHPPYDGMEIKEAARGDLRWRMTFEGNGALLYEGALPLLIQWQSELTAPRMLPDSGCALRRFVIQSPQARRVRQALQDINLRSVEVNQSLETGLAATLSTPARGEVVLSSVTVREPDNAA